MIASVIKINNLAEEEYETHMPNFASAICI